jgi:lipoprotein-anchoring transpeptidase ErfK/SrfK
MVGLETREGSFRVHMKSRDHTSSLYRTWMPFALFFAGGQAVHYSPYFDRDGYNGASHGCVNLRDIKAAEWLFDRVPIGTRVHVYRS